MSVLSASELASVRADVAAMLPDTYAILTVTETYDANGTHRSVDQGDEGYCRFATLTGRELVRARQLMYEVDCAVTVATADVANFILNERLRITCADNTLTFDVEIAYIPRRSQGFACRVLCKEVTNSLQPNL